VGFIRFSLHLVAIKYKQNLNICWVLRIIRLSNGANFDQGAIRFQV
jgi:hypothetical protein